VVKGLATIQAALEAEAIEFADDKGVPGAPSTGAIPACALKVPFGMAQGRAIPPNHKMNVLRCAPARLGFGANKNRKKRQCPPRSISDLSRLVAAHRLVIVSIILPGKNFIASLMSLKQELNSWNARRHLPHRLAGG
jgi:hypothetical protein